MVGNQFLDRRAIAEPWPTRLVGRVQLAKDLSDSVPLLFVPTIPQCGRQVVLQKEALVLGFFVFVMIKHS